MSVLINSEMRATYSAIAPAVAKMAVGKLVDIAPE